MAFPSIMYGPRNTEKVNHATQKAELGTLMVIGSRKFRYVKNSSAAALSPGVLVQSPIPNSTVAHLSSLTIGAMAIGDRTMTFSSAFTTTITKAAMQEWVDGYVVGMSSVGGGSGKVYEIESIPNAWSCAVSTNSLVLKTGVETALLATQQVSLHKNPFKNVIVHPSPPTATPMGWSQTSISTGYYGWVCVAGPTGALFDSPMPLIGKGVAPSSALDGAVGAQYLRIEGGTTAATTAIPNTAGTKALNSQGVESIIGIAGLTSVSVLDAGYIPQSLGMAMSAGGTSGENGLVWAAIES
jgi:hypothetical protein